MNLKKIKDYNSRFRSLFSMINSSSEIFAAYLSFCQQSIENHEKNKHEYDRNGKLSANSRNVLAVNMKNQRIDNICTILYA